MTTAVPDDVPPSTPGVAPATAPRPIRIAIAEDHQLVGQAFAALLGFTDGCEVVGTSPSGQGIVELVARERPDVVLMDVTLEGLNGLEATREVVAANPQCRVLVLSMHDDEDTVMDAVAAGAAGFLPKNVTSDDLLAAIRAVAAGSGFLHPSVTAAFLRRVGSLAEGAPSPDRLTGREREVLVLLAEGRTTRDIAAELIIGEETVKTHLTRIYQKLRVSDRVQAVAAALRRGLVR